VNRANVKGSIGSYAYDPGVAFDASSGRLADVLDSEHCINASCTGK
jgi:hypothetical protein